MRSRVRVGLLFAFVSLLIVIEGTNGEQQLIAEGPSDQQAKIGEQVLLKCQIRNLKGEPQWCIDDFCLGVSKKEANEIPGGQLSLKGRPRHRIVGDKANGEFHLLIEPVQLQDNMYYYCMVTAASETVKAVKSKKAFLTVLTHPQSLVLDNPVHVSLNKPSTIQCLAKQSRPPVKILVAINGRLITDESKYKTEVLQTPVMGVNSEQQQQQQQQRPTLITSFSQISLEQLRQSFYDTITNVSVDDVTMRMQGQSVECFAYSFPTGRFPSAQPSSNSNDVMSIKSLIQVDYAPEVNLRMISGNRVLKEEDVISLVCETRATPSIQSYRWYIGQNYLSGVGDSNLNLKLRREMHLQTVTCEASNIVASVKASIQLNILFKPWFVKGPRSFMLIGKSACNRPLTLDCQVTANPSGNITWYRRRFAHHSQSKNGASISNDFDDEMIGTGPTYTIASFNCANALANVRNRTKSLKTRTTSTSLEPGRKHMHHRKGKERRFRAREVLVEEGGEDSMDYGAPEEYELDDGAGEAVGGGGRVEFENEKASAGGEFDDFGVYLCEAANRLSIQMTRRFIKLNPIGTPLVHTLTSPPGNTDEAMSALMKASTASSQHVDIAASLGSSVSLVCLVEPLPHFDSIVWLRDNAIVIPNSRYSSKNSENRASVSLSTPSNTHRVNTMRNFKIKYENLTGTSKDGEDSGGRATTSTSPDGVLITNVDVGIMRSILYIKSLRRQDLGVYKCKANNAFGSRTVSLLLREKTLMDKINLDNYMIFTLCVVGMATVFFLIVLILACLLSRRARLCCVAYSDKISRDKELLSQNLNCEQSSTDKTINEWLASSKLSNDTATGSLLNPNNNNSSATTTTTTATIVLHDQAFKTHKINKLLLSSPSQLVGTSSEDENELASDSASDKKEESSASTNTCSKRDEMRCYQTGTFARFLVSSPLLPSNEDNIDLSCANAETKTIQVPPMMVIRSQNFGSANFNTKLTNNEEVTQRLLTQPNHNSPPKRSKHFNSYSLNRNNEKTQEYYENTAAQENDEDFGKILQDTSYRLSDLFNDLSPSLAQNLNSKTSHLLQQAIATNKAGNHTLPHQHHHQQQHPSLAGQSPKMPSFQQENGPLRQALLQTIGANGSNHTNSTFNKFPNPYKKSTANQQPSNNANTTTTTAISSNTSKFYTNFYRNPNIAVSNEQYGNNEEEIKQHQTSVETESGGGGVPFAKIVTTSSADGSNKYLTVI